MNTKARLTVLGITVILFGLVSFLVQRGYSFTVAKPAQSLSEFPKEFAGWQGTEEEITEGVANILDASDMLSLRFQRGKDARVFLHASTWTAPDSVAETCPHHPDICYRGNGWTPIERKMLQVNVNGIGKIPVQAVVMKRGEQRVTVAFTYRMGSTFFADEANARSAQLKLFGTPEWPAVTKFMIQTANSTISAAEPAIETFVKQFFEWQRV
jgi:EpsI family protein